MAIKHEPPAPPPIREVEVDRATPGRGMDIATATRLSVDHGYWLRNRFRCGLTMFVASGKVYRDEHYVEVTLDARDCLSQSWYVVDDTGQERWPSDAPSTTTSEVEKV